MSHRRKLLSGTCVLALALPAGAALAQEGTQVTAPTTTPVTTLETVTTIGTKTEKTFLETLGSVTVITRDQIERLQPSNLGDILQQVPGVELDGGPRTSAEEFNIRGLGSDRIVLRVDGARNNFNAGHKGRVFVDPDLLKRVEVIRGPSSIYGSGALGGVIALETIDATDLLDPGKTFGTRVKLGAQSVNDEFLQSYTVFGQHKQKIDVLVNFTSRVSGLIRAGDKEAPTQPAFVPNSKDRIKAGLIKINVEPAENHKLSFTYQIFNNDTYIPTAADTNSTSTIADRVTREERYIVGYRFKSESTKLVDLTSRIYFNKVRLGETVVDPGANFGRDDQTDLDTLGIDLYNTSRFDFFGDAVKTAITYGVEAYKDTQSGERNGQPRQQFPNAESAVTGLYVQGEFTLWDQIILLGTLRWDNFDQSAAGQRDLAASHLSKSFQIGWRPIRQVLIYGKYAEAFRAPNLTELFARGVHFPLFGPFSNNFIPNPNLRPEDSHSFEVGAAAEFRDLLWSGDRLTARVAGFRKDVEDFIDLEVINNFATFTFTSQSVNIRDARISGFEGEMLYTSRWLFGGLAGSYQIGENLSTGASLRSIPAQKIVATLGTRIPQFDVFAGWRTTFASDQNRVPPGGTETTSGYVLNDLFVSWVPSGKNVPWLRGLRVDAGIDNIFDKRYRRHLSALPDAGRNFKIAVSYTIQFNL